MNSGVQHRSIGIKQPNACKSEGGGFGLFGSEDRPEAFRGLYLCRHEETGKREGRGTIGWSILREAKPAAFCLFEHLPAAWLCEQKIP